MCPCFWGHLTYDLGKKVKVKVTGTHKSCIRKYLFPNKNFHPTSKNVDLGAV